MRTISSTSHKLVSYSLTLTLFAFSFLQSHESTLAQPTLICGDGTWTNTGDMSAIRRDHTATLLNNGKVLIAGFVTDSAELYDPATGIFSSAGRVYTITVTAVDSSGNSSSATVTVEVPRVPGNKNLTGGH